MEKVHDLQDKRVAFVQLTGQAYDLKQQIDHISAKVYETACWGFAQEEKAQFLSPLKRVNQNFSEAAAREQ